MQKFASACLFLLAAITLVFFSEEAYTQTITEIEQEEIVVDTKQIECLAKNIYYESRGEPKLGQIIVARVVMNRVEHDYYQGSPCEVIYKHGFVTKENRKVKVCQFSWACDSKRRKPMQDDPLYRSALKIAYDVFVHDAYADLVPKSVLYFHNLQVRPSWKNVVLFKRVGNHVFYKIKK
jgi:spore germination cell wall hydrolase CwlJ-like protein